MYMYCEVLLYTNCMYGAFTSICLLIKRPDFMVLVK